MDQALRPPKDQVPFSDRFHNFAWLFMSREETEIPMSKTAPTPSTPTDQPSRAEKVARLKAEVQAGTYRIKSKELVMDMLKPIADWFE
ncbi:MAG: flagellar biosynthesis anti-sigma factor FlgM [Desulfovibrio sp.]|nr:MAG: flagellar biosynthesis anti-sigma factor FlgM [Desulfovibrio sp.]